MLEDNHIEECGNFIAKNAQILTGVLSWGDILLFYPSSARNIWVSGYVHHTLKRGH